MATDAVILFAVLHSAIDRFSPAHHIDARYAQLLTEARDKGVEILAWKAELSTTKMTLNKPIAVVLNPGNKWLNSVRVASANTLFFTGLSSVTFR